MKFLVLLGLISIVRSLCTSENCFNDCSCFSTDPPNGLRVESTPQLVTLTFDDGINVVNYPTYHDLLMTGRINKGDNCSIKATFFVTHDYTNYRYVNQLYRQGSEIAVHSISHSTKPGHWQNGNATLWKAELDGMRTIISNLALIPRSEIRGTRAPFLETAGDITFRVLKDNGFTYDSSMPSRVFSDLPIWPYTLDHGYAQDCQIPPCPKEEYPGLWLIPMVNWKLGRVPCAMVDACAPTPYTINDTLEYMKDNFLRHYESSRAPFPVYLHQSWLTHEARRQAYFQFVDWMLEKDDVFLVTANEVIEYMKNPVSVDEYRERNCTSLPLPNNCQPGNACYYETTVPGGSRYMVICGACPAEFPWTFNPDGLTNMNMRVV